MKKAILFVTIFIATILLSSCKVSLDMSVDCDITTIEVGEELVMTFTMNPASDKDGMVVKVSSGDNSIASITSENKVLGVSPGTVIIKVEDKSNYMTSDICDITVIAKKISSSDVFDELVDVITEPATMDLSDDAYLTYKLSGHDTEYEFYYMQLNIDNDTYLIEYALKDATESIYETGPLSDETGNYEIQRFNQPSGHNEFWGFELIGVNMELYIIYYYQDGNIVTDQFNPMIFTPIG